MIRAELEALADATGFSGVVAITERGGGTVELARGFADRANGRLVTVDTRFGTASATKGLTALAVASLIDSGELTLATTLRSLVGDMLPRVDPAATIEQLLGHTSGVGDYLDEEELDDVDAYVLDLPVHRLQGPRDYVPLLADLPQQSQPGQRFAYNNGGYVMLSIAVESASGRSFYEVVQERVLDPAGMTQTGFFRSDGLPADVAMGYLVDGRTNVLHLPVRGAGDGGAYSTVTDVELLWDALFSGRIVPSELVETLVAPRHDVPEEELRYGLGFWLRPDRDTVMLEGSDAGVSFRSARDRASGLTYTVVSNTSAGAWPLVRLLDERLPELASG